MKRELLVASVIALSMNMGLSDAARAQDYPTREITMVVGFSAGGATDVLARIVAEHMSKSLGQRVLVENRPGANGAAATRTVARAAADGYTMIFNSSNMPINLHGMKEPGYKWDDFQIIGGIAVAPMVLVANTASSKAKTLQEMVAFGKANPGKLTFASFGPQSIANLAAQRFATISGIGWREVPYKGAPQIVTDLINGNVDGYFGLTTVASGVVNQPNVKVFAFSGKQRAPQLKDVPTFAEAGFPELDDYTVTGIWVPAGTPKAVTDKLRKAVADAVKAPALKEAAEKNGNFLYEGTPEEFDADIRKAALRYEADFKKLGIQPE